MRLPDKSTRDSRSRTSRALSTIVGEHSTLGFVPGGARLDPGDVVCLGTPGGTVITSRPQRLIDLLGVVLFWLGPLDWHDLFFGNSRNYLHNGDEVFFWAEGLGFQRHSIRRVDSR